MATIEEYYLTDIAKREELGDVETISGLENRKLALIRAAVTNKGSLVHRPDWGGNLKAYQNAPMTLSRRERMANQLAEQWRKDPFVKKVTGVQIEQNAVDQITIIARVELIGFGETVVSFKNFNEVE